MPDTPKNPTDDEALNTAMMAFWRSATSPAYLADAFIAGWRAAMAEVRKGQAKTEMPDKANWDHDREGFP